MEEQSVQVDPRVLVECVMLVLRHVGPVYLWVCMCFFLLSFIFQNPVVNCGEGAAVAHSGYGNRQRRLDKTMCR